MSFAPKTNSVAVQDVKEHLIVMAAFQHIHQTVEKSGVQLDPITGLPITTSHSVMFLARSLQRFDIWLATLDTLTEQPGLRDYEIPPLDVLMFLHAYMLSPLDFYEDSFCRRKVLGRVAEFPLARTAQLINKETLELTPTPEQAEFWTRTTSLPFSIPYDGQSSHTFSVQCPRCEGTVTVGWKDVSVVDSPTLPSGVDGFDTQTFHAHCAICQLSITPSALSAGRFLRDTYNSCLAHTLLTDTGAFPEFAVAREASLKIAQILGPRLNYQTAGEKHGWDIERIVQCVTSHLDQKDHFKRKFAEVTEAYAHPSDFAIDLSKAVFRQARFIFQMSAMGWLEKGRFDVDDRLLLQAMEHYEQFLRVDSVGMIARWNLDLIWHTHQLHAAKYRSDTLRILGYVLDHDDGQPQDVIMHAAQHAETVWKAKFGHSYLLPDDPELTATLAKTICGGASGGSCLNGEPRSGGGSGGGSSGGGKPRSAVVESQSAVVLVN